MTTFTHHLSRVLGESHWGGLPHMETDTRDSCYAWGNQRCGHLDGRCNQGPRYPYDDSWMRAKELLERELQDE